MFRCQPVIHGDDNAVRFYTQGAAYTVVALERSDHIATTVKIYQHREPGIRGWVLYWRNPLWCFFLFFLYLLSLPVLGMLIGGVSFVYVLMGVLGGWDCNKPITHAAFALGTIGAMWCLFTFGLGVLLPPGMILGQF